MAASLFQALRAFFPRVVVASLLCAVAAALPWALVDALRISWLESAARNPAFFASVFIMYALPSLVLGFAGALVAAALRPWLEQRGKGETVAAAIAILLPALFLGWGPLFTVGYASIYFLQRTLDPWSLAAYGGIVATTGALFAASAAFLFKGERFRRPGARAWGRRIGWAAATLVLVSFFVVRTTDRPAKPIVSALPAAKGEEHPRPNILLISIDTLRSDHLATYGYPRQTSPFTDTLARQGALFRNSRSQTSCTRSSAASLITSLVPTSHGVLCRAHAIPENVTTVFEYLKPHGYRTAVFSGNVNVSPVYGFGQGVDTFPLYPEGQLPQRTFVYRILRRLHFPVRMLLRVSTPRSAFHLHYERTSRDLWVVRQFQEWLGAPNAQPFFAYIHLLGVHDSYIPPPPYDGAYGSRDRSQASEAPPDDRGNVVSPGEPIAESIRLEMIDRYDGLIRFSDARVRNAVEAVRRKGLLDDTLVIVTADHGEAFWEHKTWGHGSTLYDEVLRVPLVMWAGQGLRKRSGPIPLSLQDVPVSTIDVMPTVLSLAGVDCPTCEGENLVELVERGRRSRAIFTEQYVKQPGIYIYATQNRQHKLIYTNYPDENWERWELYDLVADPAEEKNILGGAPDRAFSLFEEMQTRREAALAKRSAPATVDLKKHLLLYEELKALGYVN